MRKTYLSITKMAQVRQKLKGKKVVLVSGCYDILHAGHVDFFRFAKKQGDVLILGLDNDDNIRMNKGKGRPIFSFEKRVTLLSELRSIDYIFKIERKVSFNSKMADQMLEEILRKIKPDLLITNPYSDISWTRKRLSCKRLKVKFELFKDTSISSSTRIAEILKLIDG